MIQNLSHTSRKPMADSKFHGILNQVQTAFDSTKLGLLFFLFIYFWTVKRWTGKRETHSKGPQSDSNPGRCSLVTCSPTELKKHFKL